MANQYVNVGYDKFTDVTKIKMKRYCTIHIAPTMDMMLQYDKDAKSENLTLIIRCEYKEWFFLRDGDVIISIDGKENVTLNPHEVYTDVKDGRCVEVDAYFIDKELLVKMCKADNIDIKVSGHKFYVISSKYSEFDHPDISSRIIKYCRRFFNGVYDENAYPESLVEEAKNTGCMVAAVIGVSSIAALSSGAYYLISNLLC